MSLSFDSLEAEREPKQLIPHVLPWIQQAGDPYFRWLFGGEEAARRVLDGWMRRDSSEVSIKRVTLLRRDNEPVGGFLALGGADVGRCRKADTLAIIRDIASDERAAFLARMAAVRGLFAAPAPSEYYLSKMGVIREARGARLGHVILEAYLESGETAGYRKFRLDVSAENDAAIKLYESAGFRVLRESTSTRARMTYLAMGLG